MSIASLWEIAIKQSINKLDIDATSLEIANKCTEVGIDIMPIRPQHLDLIKTLPTIHNDPFDRLIMSQAISEGMALISRDEKIAQYSEVDVIW